MRGAAASRRGPIAPCPTTAIARSWPSSGRAGSTRSSRRTSTACTPTQGATPRGSSRSMAPPARRSACAAATAPDRGGARSRGSRATRCRLQGRPRRRPSAEASSSLRRSRSASRSWLRTWIAPSAAAAQCDVLLAVGSTPVGVADRRHRPAGGGRTAPPSSIVNGGPTAMDGLATVRGQRGDRGGAAQVVCGLGLARRVLTSSSGVSSPRLNRGRSANHQMLAIAAIAPTMPMAGLVTLRLGCRPSLDGTDRDRRAGPATPRPGAGHLGVLLARTPRSRAPASPCFQRRSPRSRGMPLKLTSKSRRSIVAVASNPATVVFGARPGFVPRYSRSNMTSLVMPRIVRSVTSSKCLSALRGDLLRDERQLRVVLRVEEVRGLEVRVALLLVRRDARGLDGRGDAGGLGSVADHDRSFEFREQPTDLRGDEVAGDEVRSSSGSGQPCRCPEPGGSCLLIRPVWLSCCSAPLEGYEHTIVAATIIVQVDIEWKDIGATPI